MAKESIPLGLKYSCMLKDTAENDVLQESILRGSLLFSQKLLLIFFDTPMTLNISKDNHLTHINSWLSDKLFIRNCGVGGGGYLGRLRLQNLSPALGRTISSIHPPGSSLTHLPRTNWTHPKAISSFSLYSMREGLDWSLHVFDSPSEIHWTAWTIFCLWTQ